MDLIGSYSDISDEDDSAEGLNQTGCLLDGNATSTSITGPQKTESDKGNLLKQDEHEGKADYFGLSSSSSPGDEDQEKTDSKIITKSTPCLSKDKTSDLTKSKWCRFWQGNDGNIDWHDQKSIWKSSNDDDDNSQNQELVSTIPEKQNKMAKSDAMVVPFKAQSDESENTNMKMTKTCFFVHHKISPFIHSTKLMKKIPKRCTSRFTGHQGAVNRIQWCSENYSHLLLSACMDRTVKVWNVLSATNPCVQTLKHHSKAVKDAKWSPSGREILSCGYDKSSCLMDVEKGSCISRFADSNYVTCLSYHPVVRDVFVSGSTNCLKAWDTRTPSKPIKQFQYKDKFGQVQDLTFLPDGHEFFTCNDLVTRDSSDRNIMAWDFNKGVAISNQIYQERYTCCRLKIHHQDSSLLAQSQGNYVAIFATTRPYKMNKCKRYDKHKVESYSVGFDVSGDGQMLVSGTCDGTVPVYDYRTSRVLHRLDIGQREICMDVAWHPVLSGMVAMTTWSGSVMLWT